ncbi:MAG: 2-oxo acid dehydrogenase subunit E2 [Clostridia bacterium]|jgi:pyruvate dehydrogenase E2 component (dihydrolipoamide acetyltransferase)|nr:2-oxo acid dehydrogenase subunit E2 [Clostridia bacterium]MBT7123157.1 2-oxo acid dehydrogenase subunit E2 [Clostridia bacterium]
MSIIMATPAARKAAGDKRVDLARIHGTGVTGYVQLSDVLAFKGFSATPLAQAVAQYYNVDINQIDSRDTIGKEDVLAYKQAMQDNVIPLSGMRSVIARRMSESLTNAPQYTNHGSIDAGELKVFLAQLAQQSVASGGIKPTYSDLLIKAAAMALRDNMIMNSSFMETHIKIHEQINVGLAVALEDGLIVPNIKNADRLSIGQITAERKRLVGKAREGRLAPEEYSGGTFTISNMGAFPVDDFTPIINLPEAAILGVGTIADTVVPVDGNIGIRPIMRMSVTSDHRHIDGAVSGMFMKRLKEIIEHPTCMEDSNG